MPLEDDRGLAAAGLVHRRVVRAAGRGAGLQRVQRDVRALAGQRRGQLLEPVPAAPRAAAALPAADDDVLALVEAQQLRERQVEAGGDLRRDRDRRARLAALDLREHRRADPAALGEVAQREAHRVAQRVNSGADAIVLGGLVLLCGAGSSLRSYVITYKPERQAPGQPADIAA